MERRSKDAATPEGMAASGLSAKEGRLEIARGQFPPARYVMQLSWQCEGNAYYQEFPLNLLGR